MNIKNKNKLSELGQKLDGIKEPVINYFIFRFPYKYEYEWFGKY